MSKKDVRSHLDETNRQQQLVNLALDEAERRFRDGTATSQMLVYFGGLADRERRLKAEKLKLENALLDAKTKAIESQASAEELYRAALDAMKSYSGEYDEDDM